MKIFLDANVLISVLNKEYPVFPYSSRILGLAEDPKYKVYTSPICFAIAFYFAEKKSGNLHARHKLDLLAQKIHFTKVGPETVEKVMKNKLVYDIEDGLQYYSAIESGCTCLITEDRNDFFFADMEVLTSRDFMENYMS